MCETCVRFGNAGGVLTLELGDGVAFLAPTLNQKDTGLFVIALGELVKLMADEGTRAKVLSSAGVLQFLQEQNLTADDIAVRSVKWIQGIGVASDALAADEVARDMSKPFAPAPSNVVH